MAENIPNQVSQQQQPIILPDVVEAATGQPMPIAQGPSTPENQQLTADVLQKKAARQDEYLKAREMLAKRLQSVRPGKALDPIELEQKTVEYMEGLQAESDAQKAKEEAANKAQDASKVARLQQYMDAKNRAAKLGIQVQEDPEMEDYLKAKIPATPESIEQASIPTQKDVETELAPIKQEQAKQQAQVIASADKMQQLQDQKTRINQQIQEEEEAFQKIDPNRFWNSKTTGEKIGLGIALFLGAAGGSRGNTAAAYINKAIEDDVSAQKLDRDQALKKKEWALKLVDQQLKEMEAKTDNELKRVQISKIRQDMNLDVLKLQQERMKMQAISEMKASGSINPDLLDADERNRLVALPDGSFKLAINSTRANEFTKFASEALPALRRAEQYRGLIEDGSVFNLKDRAQAKAIETALIGALRLPYLGPGVMTDTERDNLREAIGKFGVMSLSAVEKEKIKTVIRDLRTTINESAKMSGFDMPQSAREQFIQYQAKRRPDLSVDQIENEVDNMIKKGQLSPKYGR